MDAVSVYREELRQLRHGYPIYEPDRGIERGKVRIGDVGYVDRYGFFHTTFNVFHTMEAPYNRPDGYTPLDLDSAVTYYRADLPAGTMHSKHVSANGCELSGSCLAANATIKLSVSNSRGAALVLKNPAVREDAIRTNRLKEHMLLNYYSWWTFIHESLGIEIKIRDIVLVTGCDLTSDWATTTFVEKTSKCEIEFKAGDPAMIASGSVAVWGTWQSSTSIPSRCGPNPRGEAIQPQNRESYDQCIFIRGFRVSERIPLVPRVMEAAAEPVDLEMDRKMDGAPMIPVIMSIEDDSDFDEYGSDAPGCDTDFPVQNIHDTLSDIILQNTDADVALVHDDDVCYISEIVGDNPQELLKEDFLQSYGIITTKHLSVSASNIKGVGQFIPSNTSSSLLKKDTSDTSVEPNTHAYGQDTSGADYSSFAMATPSSYCSPFLEDLDRRDLDQHQSSSFVAPYPDFNSSAVLDDALGAQAQNQGSVPPPPYSASSFTAHASSFNNSPLGSDISYIPGNEFSQHSPNPNAHAYVQGTSTSGDDYTNFVIAVVPPDFVVDEYDPSAYDVPADNSLLFGQDWHTRFSEQTQTQTHHHTQQMSNPNQISSPSPSTSSLGSNHPGVSVSVITALDNNNHANSFGGAPTDLRRARSESHGHGGYRRNALSADMNLSEEMMSSGGVSGHGGLSDHGGHSRSLSRDRASLSASPYPSPHASPRTNSNEPLPDAPYAFPSVAAGFGGGGYEGGAPTVTVMGTDEHGDPTMQQQQPIQASRQNVTTHATADASSRRRRTDANFACPVPGCGSTFMRPFILKGHLRSHNEERPFKCKWPGCEKGFARQHDCKRHEQLHLNIRPYTCQGCQRTFARMDALNRHLRSVAGTECQARQPILTNDAPNNPEAIAAMRGETANGMLTLKDEHNRGWQSSSPPVGGVMV